MTYRLTRRGRIAKHLAGALAMLALDLALVAVFAYAVAAYLLKGI